jgi:hypothetical protein
VFDRRPPRGRALLGRLAVILQQMDASVFQSPDAVQVPVKFWSNAGQILVQGWSNILVKRQSKAGQTLDERRSNAHRSPRISTC